jgi:hypothetical protein
MEKRWGKMGRAAIVAGLRGKIYSIYPLVN